MRSRKGRRICIWPRRTDPAADALQTISGTEDKLNDMAIRDDGCRRSGIARSRDACPGGVALQRAIARSAPMRLHPGFGFAYMPPDVDPAAAFRVQEDLLSMGMSHSWV